MTRTLYIVGTGGQAKDVALLAHDILESGQRRWSAIEYLAEREADVGKPMPFGVVTATDALLSRLSTKADVAIGIGQPQLRRRIATSLLALPLVDLPNLVHPQAGFDPRLVKLGVGNLVARGAVFTCDITVASFNVFNPNCTIGHDAELGSFNVFNPGCNISGGVRIGDACLLGTGCQVLERLSIVSDTTVGAGAVVTASIGTPGVYVGVPARAKS